MDCKHEFLCQIFYIRSWWTSNAIIDYSNILCFFGEKNFGVKFPKKDHRKYSMLKLCQDSLAVQWLRLHLPTQGVQVWSLVGELRTHMPWNQKTKHKQQKQYCNKFNKDFLNGPHQKKNIFKEKENRKISKNWNLVTHLRGRYNHK